MAIKFSGFLKSKLSLYIKNPIIKYPLKTYNKYIRKHRSAVQPLFNRNLMLALTYQCQCKCIHCGSASYKQDKKNELASNEIFGLIDQAKRLGAKGIYFFGGEPLLVPKLPYYIKYAKQNDFLVKCDTNGLLLDEYKVQELKDSGIDLIGVSIDSPYETVHDKLRGINGIFKKAINGIKYCSRYGIKCFISTYATKENLKNGDLEKTINLAKSLGVKTRILSSICCGKWVNRNDLVLSPGEIKLLKRLLEKDMVYWEMKELDYKDTSFSCAAFEENFFYVSAYGDIQLCCYLPVTFGNVREESLEKIIKKMWKSKIFIFHEKYKDCPVNNQYFVDKCTKLIELKGNYPIRFEDYFLTTEIEEWDKWASDYKEDVDHLLGSSDEMICSRISFKDKTVLDVGCGTGRFSKIIASDARHITLLDFSNKMLEEAKKELKDFHNVSFKNLDIGKIALSSNEKYDIIILLYTMHHIRNIEDVIEKLKSYLVENGQIIIVDILSGRSKKDRYLFHVKSIKKYGFLKSFRTLYRNAFSYTQLRRHLSKENFIALEDFKKIYGSLLPQSKIEVINGICVFLQWHKSM